MHSTMGNSTFSCLAIGIYDSISADADHSRDPWEWTNLAARPEYADVIEEHKKWLPKNEK